MKTILLFLVFLGMLSTNAQPTTHQIFWAIGVNGAAASRVIVVGDTVEWIWNDTSTHTVTNLPGSAELFDSGNLTGMGTIYRKTFMVVGFNDYQCNFHPDTMFGSIDVTPLLDVDDLSLRDFTMSPNPVATHLKLQLPIGLSTISIQIFDVLGKKVFNKKMNVIGVSIDVSKWSSGVYLLRVSTENESHTKRFVKL